MQTIHASSLFRLELCPGSLQAQAPIAQMTSEAAESGNRVHHVLAEMMDPITLTTSEALKDEIARYAERRKLTDREEAIVGWFASIVVAVCAEHGGPADVRAERRLRLELDEVVIMGMLDLLIVMADKTTHIFEFKTGRAEVDTSDVNLQGQVYAMMVAAKTGLHPIVVHLLGAGNEEGETHTHTEYDLETLGQVQDRIIGIALRVMQDAPELCPGTDQCTYCRAAGTQFCPASCEALKEFSERTAALTVPEAVFNDLSPMERGKALETCKLVAKVAGTILDAGKELLAHDADAIEGWTLTEGSKRRQVANVGAAYQVLSQKAGVMPTEFVDICEVKIGKLEAMFYEHELSISKPTGDKKPSKKGCAEMLQSILGDLIEIKQTAGSLKQVK